MPRKLAVCPDILAYPGHTEGRMPEAIDLGPMDVIYLRQLLEPKSELESEQPECSDMPGTCEA
jgi:hypothetical protein